MSVFYLLFVLALIGGAAVLLVKLFKVEAGNANIIYLVASVICVLYALHAFGIGIPNPSVPQVR